ncbi:MAG TPA: methyltransferase domain-containing protein [Verrucomicrobiae bacterium]|nr:methyltransferase domain-containing protein [Verrucomicrobiae bacterium]
MFFPWRARTPEIMDGVAFTAAELEHNLADLDRYHRVTGGERLLVSRLAVLARDLPRGEDLRVLDVGAGGAGIAARVSAWARRRGLVPRVVASDIDARMLTHASARRLPGADVALCQSDGRHLPHADGAFAVAYSSLLLHHLDDADVASVLDEMRRVTRLGFVVADLRRSALAYSAVWALTRLTTRNRLTLHDGPLSVRRSFTPGEMRAAASRLPGEGLTVRRQGPARLVVTFRHETARGAA